MKKVFELTHPKKAPVRLGDAIKHEVKKYILRERKKPLAPGVDYWDFDCKIGLEANSALAIHVDDIHAQIDKFIAQEKSAFYLEILAKPGHRKPKTED
jgi:hypothetical protein